MLSWWVAAVCACACVCVEIKGRHVCLYEPWDPLWPTNTLRDISNWITAGGEQLSLWAGWGICYDKQTKSQLSLDVLGSHLQSHTHTYVCARTPPPSPPSLTLSLPAGSSSHDTPVPFTPPSPFPPLLCRCHLPSFIFPSHLQNTATKRGKREKFRGAERIWCENVRVQKKEYKIVRVRAPGAEMLR